MSQTRVLPRWQDAPPASAHTHVDTHTLHTRGMKPGQQQCCFHKPFRRISSKAFQNFSQEKPGLSLRDLSLLPSGAGGALSFCSLCPSCPLTESSALCFHRNKKSGSHQENHGARPQTCRTGVPGPEEQSWQERKRR